MCSFILWAMFNRPVVREKSWSWSWNKVLPWSWFWDPESWSWSGQQSLIYLLPHCWTVNRDWSKNVSNKYLVCSFWLLRKNVRFRWHSLRRPTKGWPGWAHELSWMAWLHTVYRVYHPNTNPVQRRVTSLMQPMMLPLGQAANRTALQPFFSVQNVYVRTSWRGPAHNATSSARWTTNCTGSMFWASAVQAGSDGSPLHSRQSTSLWRRQSSRQHLRSVRRHCDNWLQNALFM